MPIYINSPLEAEMFLMRDLNKVIDDLMMQIKKEIRSSIMQDVYSIFKPEVYHRHNKNGEQGFLSSFDKAKEIPSRNMIEGMIYHDPELMFEYQYSDDEPEKFEHGSPISDPEDIRDSLFEIITKGKAGDLFGKGPWQMRRDFTKSVDVKMRGEVFDTLFVRCCKKIGLEVIKIG